MKVKELEEKLVESCELHSEAVGLEMETARLRMGLWENEENLTKCGRNSRRWSQGLVSKSVVE